MAVVCFGVLTVEMLPFKIHKGEHKTGVVIESWLDKIKSSEKKLQW